MQRQRVRVGVAHRGQLKAFIRAGDAHLVTGHLHERLLARGQLSFADLQQFAAGRGIEQFAGNAGRQLRRVGLESCRQRVVEVLKGLIARLEQRACVASGEVRHLLAQVLAADLNGRRRSGEGLVQQGFDLRLVEGLEQGFEHVATDQFALAQFGHGQGCVGR